MCNKKQRENVEMLDMANCFCPGRSEEAAAWVQCQDEMNKDTSFIVPLLHSSDSNSFQFHGYPYSGLPFEEVAAEDKGASTSKSHSQAEKRRRDRINSQLATLRKLIPKSEKMDKAALLGCVVEHVKDLKRKALEVSKVFTVPTDVDEVSIIDCDFDQYGSKENMFIKASVCCDDRPELFAELSQALKSLRLTTVQADMTSLGGRIKGIFVLCSNSTKESVGMNTLKQTLKVALNRIATSSTTSNYSIKSKRQRFFLPSDQ